MSWFDYTPVGFVLNTAIDEMGTPDHPYASVQDIDAITRYIADAQGEAAQYPEAQTIISDYGKWRSNLSWYKLNMDTGVALSEAKYYRDRLNEVLNRKLPEGSIPGDAAFAIQYPPAPKDPTPKTPLIPTSYKIAAVASGSAIALLVILKKIKVI